jgi:hypothetical protein
MFNWYREWLQIRKEARICESCETLKHQLEVVNYEKKQLLDRLLEKPAVVEQPKEPIAITKPSHLPWAIKRQMLEAEDRERARLLREAPKPQSTEELEKELDIATAEREAKTS